MPPVYLDNLATTPTDPRVLEAMLPYFTEHFGNPASATHGYGWKAAEAIDEARARVAALIGASPREIIFTSGGTEANNLAIKGVAGRSMEAAKGRSIGNGLHIITCETEHKSVIDACSSLEGRGVSVTRLPVDQYGRVDPGQVLEAIQPETMMISLMAANNEIGTIQPFDAVAALATERGILVHCDAVQAVGKIPVDVNVLGADLLSLSGHKIYGPKGVGALYVRSRRPRVRLLPQIEGGGQEKGIRSGTLNVPGIVGLGMACEIAGQELLSEGKRLVSLRERLVGGLREKASGFRLNGHPADRLPGSLSLSFKDVDGVRLLSGIKGIALSSGAACSSGGEISHVLKAIGLDETLALATLRFGIGRFNTTEQIDATIEKVAETALQSYQGTRPSEKYVLASN